LLGHDQETILTEEGKGDGDSSAFIALPKGMISDDSPKDMSSLLNKVSAFKMGCHLGAF